VSEVTVDAPQCFFEHGPPHDVLRVVDRYADELRGDALEVLVQSLWVHGGFFSVRPFRWASTTLESKGRAEAFPLA
jgi:hypothetical protein